jgi:hypothetical protein
LLLATLALALIGCQKAPPELVPVKGKVRTHGRSVEGFKITFWPQGHEVARVPSDLLKGDGSFNLECPKGIYKVTLVPRSGANTGVGGGATNASLPSAKQDNAAVPPDYQDSHRTPWTVEVLAADNDNIVLELK